MNVIYANVWGGNSVPTGQGRVNVNLRAVQVQSLRFAPEILRPDSKHPQLET
jgi:hypothetical protein